MQRKYSVIVQYGRSEEIIYNKNHTDYKEALKDYEKQMNLVGYGFHVFIC